jgi:hypothetical protein
MSCRKTGTRSRDPGPPRRLHPLTIANAMYLARLNDSRGIRYQLRRSYRVDATSFDYRIVYDLGDNPSRYIESFDDRCVFFDGGLLAAVAAETDEHLVPPRTAAHRPTPISTEEGEEIARQVHLFDRRRLYYLRYGAVDQSRLFRLHEKCCRPLLGQCRDEREYAFTAEEAGLEPGLYRQYVYAIFDVQKHFHQSFAPWFPEALAQDEVEEPCTTSCAAI